MQALCILPQSLRVHMFINHVCLEGLGLLLSSIPSGYYTVSASPSEWFSGAGDEGFAGDMVFEV